ncbi:MAG TPA: saccharopine dehydrogenase NADP-binding domain-containing protein [Solirubrobacteraceae bacterium]
MPGDRAHDIVLFGASGFTGSLAAQYLATHAHEGLRWALAGRGRAKLQALCERLQLDVPIIEADVSQPASVRALAESTRVAVSTVGPYIRYGEPLVEACALAGTDYIDITGEPEFVDNMYIRHHERALQSGARLVHCCGFDSIPHDLGALFTVQQLPEGVPLKVEGFVRMRGSISGGTLHSAIAAFSRIGSSMSAARSRKALEQHPTDRRIHGTAGRPHNERGIGWVLPMPTIDPQVVLRSAAALPRYGPDFSYGHYFVTGNLPASLGLTSGVLGAVAMAQLGPTRKLLLDRIDPGQGPSPQRRASSSFSVRFIGQGGGKRVLAEVSGGDPGYDETAKMLSEAALCLACDDALPDRAGQLTSAVAMGDALRERLQRADISFSVLEERAA